MTERNMRNECYTCKFRRNIAGDAHISCANPDLSLTGDEHGIRSGWFMYPWNFDPVWKTADCKNYEEK